MKYNLLLLLLLTANHKVLPISNIPLRQQVCLAKAIYMEAGNQSIKGQIAVGNVVMNRVHMIADETVCDIVYQHRENHWQFSWANHNIKIPSEKSQYFIDLADSILSGSIRLSLPRNVMYVNNEPFRSKSYCLYQKIGALYFYSKKYH